MAAHPVFGDDCDLPEHQVGDRHDNGNGTFQEWTGAVWALVCPECDVPMAGRDPDGWLACELCGIRAVEAVER